jgi:hypothetical protein
MKNTIVACWFFATTHIVFASDPFMDNAIEFVHLLGLGLQGTNAVVSHWTVPMSPIAVSSCSGSFSAPTGRNDFYLELTNAVGTVVSSVDLVKYSSCDEALIGLALSMGGSSSALLSRIAADTTVSTNQTGIIEFGRMTTNPQRGFTQKWFLFRNLALSFRVYLEFDAETAAVVLLRAGGVDISDDPFRSSPAPESFQVMRVFSSGSKEPSDSPPPAPESFQAMLVFPSDLGNETDSSASESRPESEIEQEF